MPERYPNQSIGPEEPHGNGLPLEYGQSTDGKNSPRDGRDYIKLSEILDMLGQSEEILDFVAQKIQDGSDEFKDSAEVKRHIRENAVKHPLKLAKLIDSRVGRGTMRVLSFMGSDPRAPKDVLEILESRDEDNSFDREVELGMYMGIMESYDVKWSLEKVARDIWQNFFDANKQTLDGLESKLTFKNGSGILRVEGAQDYDWRELVHIGASSKSDTERSAGGFGEGAKMLALILLRDYGTKEVRFTSRDWEIEYYLADVPEASYGKPARGLYVKKTRVTPTKGNAIEIVSNRATAREQFDALQDARALFYSHDNPDFQNPTYDNPDQGGFKVLPLTSSYPYIGRGNFYMAGQRINYVSRDNWQTVGEVNIWVWRKILTTTGRDRGIITAEEMRDKVIPFVVDGMSQSEKTDSVYAFKPYWSDGSSSDVGYKLQSRIVDALSAGGIRLEFEPVYLSNDTDDFFNKNGWIAKALKQKGYTVCHGFLKKVGMKTVLEQFKDLQTHIRVEATPREKKRIDLLKQAAIQMGAEKGEVKDVWLFGREQEKSIFEGQYNGMFYWMSKEMLGGSFFDAMSTYMHELAHKAGPHGTAEFEYTLQQQIQKIQKFMDKNRGKYQALEQEWSRL